MKTTITTITTKAGAVKPLRPQLEDEPEHTPGEWRQGGKGVFAGNAMIATAQEQEFGSDGQIIIEGPTHDEAIENARLIAAAPALLEACRFGVRLFLAMAKDADPHIDLKRGESAKFDAACDALDVFRSAISRAAGNSTPEQPEAQHSID